MPRGWRRRCSPSPTQASTTLFGQFLNAFPATTRRFLNLDAASRRMTDETLQAMFGLWLVRGWVWPQIAEQLVTHALWGADGGRI